MKILSSIKFAVEIIRIHIRFVYVFIRHKSKFVSIKDLLKYKKNSKLIILGSGQSINDFMSDLKDEQY